MYNTEHYCLYDQWMDGEVLLLACIRAADGTDKSMTRLHNQDIISLVKE
jgi:hypothetical protein